MSKKYRTRWINVGSFREIVSDKPEPLFETGEVYKVIEHQALEDYKAWAERLSKDLEHVTKFIRGIYCSNALPECHYPRFYVIREMSKDTLTQYQDFKKALEGES